VVRGTGSRLCRHLPSGNRRVHRRRYIRDLVDSRFANHHGRFISKVADLDGKEVTLRVPLDAVIAEEKIASMLRHRAMRIDPPLWRGRPLRHFFDPS
jgi:hypothetical protein